MTDDDSKIRYQEASCLRFFYVHSGRFSYYDILYLPAFVFDSDPTTTHSIRALRSQHQPLHS